MPKLLTWLKRLIITLLFLALLAINVLSLTHTAFNATLSGILATALGLQTVSSVLGNKVATHRKAIQAKKLAINKQRAEIDRQRKSIESHKAAAHRQKLAATKRRPRCSRRVMLCPIRPRCTPSGFTNTNVRSKINLQI